jgi:uncharacterized delta-60 repeat protein
MNHYILRIALWLCSIGYAWAQSGANDITFNTIDNGLGNGADFQKIATNHVLSNGKVLIGGDFSTYDGDTVKCFARLNADGSLDKTFNTGHVVNGELTKILVQSDGKIIIAGDFTTYRGTSVNRIARLNPDGSIDNSFNIGTGANAKVYDMEFGSSGDIIVVGNFTEFNGSTTNRIVVLESTGNVSTFFSSGTGADNTICCVAYNAGRIVIGGLFSNYKNTSLKGICALYSSGSIDASFNVGAGIYTYPVDITIQSDGKVLVAGWLGGYNNVPAPNLIRINTDGTRDNTFQYTGLNSHEIYAVKIQSDNKIVFGGLYDIGRLNSDGTTDNTFSSSGEIYARVNSLFIQSDGKILVGGSFTSFYATPRRRIVRLNQDGTTDSGFNVKTGADETVLVVKIQEDQKILAGGLFKTFNGVLCNHFVRLNNDGSVDNTFNLPVPNERVTAIQPVENGKIIIAGLFSTLHGQAAKYVARLNVDGTIDNSFNTGVGPDDVVSGINLLNNGKIILTGQFSNFNTISSKQIVMLNTDGSVDESFVSPILPNQFVKVIAVDNSNRILAYIYEPVNNYTLLRLNTNGTIDNTFLPITGSNDIRCIEVLPDNSVLIGGGVFSIQGESFSGLAHLDPDGNIAPGFNIGSGFNGTVTTLLVNGDKLIVCGSFTSYNNSQKKDIVKLNLDGSLDNSFDPGNGFEIATGTFNSFPTALTMAMQNDGRLIVGGAFNSYNGVRKNRIVRIQNNIVTMLDEARQVNEPKVYPNPTNGEVNVELESLLNIRDIEVVDIRGRIVQKFVNVTPALNRISIVGPTGIYVLVIRDVEDNEYTYRILKR